MSHPGKINDDGSEKLHFWIALHFFVQVIRVCLHKAKKILRILNNSKEGSFHVLILTATQLSSMHSNVQLLYLLWFLSAVVSAADLIALAP